MTINLTFVYALFAHAHIKQTNLSTILVRSFNYVILLFLLTLRVCKAINVIAVQDLDIMGSEIVKWQYPFASEH